MGVFTLTCIPVGRLYGPIPTSIMLTDPAMLIGHMTADKRLNIHTVTLNIEDFCEGTQAAEWVPYVQAARDNKEQNMEAFLKNGSLYFRTIKRLERHDELLVWFSEDYARQLNIPKLDDDNTSPPFQCRRCNCKFEYPYSYRAHVKFKCQASKPKNSNSNSSAMILSTTTTTTTTPKSSSSSLSPNDAAVTPKPPPLSPVMSAILPPTQLPPTLPTSVSIRAGIENTHLLNAGGVLKFNNPMVEKILSCASLPPAPAPSAAVSMQTPLNQNWCAKCNATFRMTSDLVYHMRTHHKCENRSPVATAPSQRIRRDEKLRCSVCGEGFRERHHLTRHMTSHI